VSIDTASSGRASDGSRIDSRRASSVGNVYVAWPATVFNAAVPCSGWIS
jgi:hypothetical protein